MTRSRRPAPRAPLQRDSIAAEALALIDAEGFEACSMRRLGTRLGVEAMALYHHLPSKGELLDAVQERLLAEIDLPARGALPPLQRLRRFAESYRACALRHPAAFVLLAARRFNTPAAFATYERVLEAFADLGLDAAASARWFRLVGGFVNGAGMAEVASRERVADATPLALERAPDALGDFPRVRAVAPHLGVKALDSIFGFGLDVLFAALAAEAAALSSARRPGARRSARTPRPA